LSGGHVPVGAVLARKNIFDKVFDRMDRAVAHGSTFGNNDLAMAAGIATLDVLKSERLIENAARTGEHLLDSVATMIPRYEFLRDVRGKIENILACPRNLTGGPVLSTHHDSAI
jgi:ornithine--oxo-acid transaminase